MKLRSDSSVRFKMNEYEAQYLFSALHKINNYGKKPGFVKSIQFSEQETQVLGVMRDMLNDAYGLEETNTVGKGGGHQSSGLITTQD